VALETRIRACYESLPGSEASVADVLLNHPGRLATHSATELAADAGVSKAAVTRLIQRLGYDSHAAARNEARLARQWGAPLYLQTDAPLGEGRKAAYAEHVAADQQSLAHTLHGLDEAALQGSVRALAAAGRVVVLGFRNSAWLALYARIQLGLLRPAVDLAPLPSQTLCAGPAARAGDVRRRAVAVPLIVGRALKLSPEQVAMLISADLFCCGLVTLIQSLGAHAAGSASSCR
jgi:DNA-binding MurR/RpiR family transcriptional regulator